MSTPSAPSRPSPEELQAMSEAAKARLQQHHAAIEKLHADYKAVMKTTGDYWFQASFSTATMLVYTVTKLSDMIFDDSDLELDFHGELWGVGIAGVAGYGGGYFGKSPEWLLDHKVQFELASGGGGLGGVQITFWYKGTAIGAYDGVGGGVGIGGGWGDGSFKKA